MSNDAFLQVLDGCTEVAAGMDLRDDGWSPPDGTYIVSIDEVSSGLKERNKVNNAWIKPIFTITEGEFQGQTFSDYFWIEPVMSEPSISLRNLCRFATCLQGSETRNPIEAVEIAKASAGQFLEVEVYRTTAKKGKNIGKIYANIRYLSRIDATQVETEVETVVE